MSSPLLISRTQALVVFIVAATTFMGDVAQGYHINTAYEHRRVSTTAKVASSTPMTKEIKGKLLVLGGTGFLGQTICKRATLEGYSVTSVSRRGRPPPESSSSTFGNIEYRQGDATKRETVSNILNDGGYVGESFIKQTKDE
jgi:hypothetical protein